MTITPPLSHLFPLQSAHPPEAVDRLVHVQELPLLEGSRSLGLADGER